MYRNASCIALTLALFAGLSLSAGAQQEKQPKKDEPPPPAGPREDYREFFRKPETPAEFWRAIRFEMEVGRFDLAARLLHTMLEKKPDDKDLLEIEQKEGMSAFLRLLTVPQWSKDPKLNEQAKKDAQELLDRASAALKKVVGDPARINKFIHNLNGDPEERAYALKELYRSGELAVPHLIDALRTADAEERLAILSALPKLGRGTLPPLFAALDSDDPELRADLIDVFQQRRAKEAVPHLWYLSAAPRQPDRVRQKATAALAALLDTEPSRLPPAKLALTREAERYYKHQVPFTDPQAVKVWRWDGKHLVEGWPPKAVTIPATRAEEYYGLRFAGQALDLDPTYQPAQVIFLSLALEKGVEQAGLDQPLLFGAPRVNDLVSTTSPELLIAVLDRALNENRLPVVLGAARALGDVADVRAARSSAPGQSVLVRALNYPDRRVQFAAAESLLRIPGIPNPPAPARTVEVLRRLAALDPTAKAPKVLLGIPAQEVLDKAADTLREAGYEPIKVQTGRELLRRLNESADIDAIVFDASLPDPGLSSLLGQLRADVNGGRLPLLVASPRERESNVRGLVEGRRNVAVIPAALVLDADGMRQALEQAVRDSGSPPLSELERRGYAEGALRWLARLGAGLVPGYDIRPATDTLLGVVRASKVSEQALAAALDALSRLPGRDVQGVLANVVLDAGRPGRTPELRAVAAQDLARHIQQHGPALAPGMVQALEQLHQRDPDAVVRSAVAVVLGSMRPDARLTGERLKNFTPQPVAPEPPPEKEKEKP